MTETVGRREANKRATRAALRSAANELFAEHGYDATSIRQIADRAGVGERTFYRYYDGKEALLADDLDRWLELLAAAIGAQPLGRPPLEIVRDAVLDLSHRVGRGEHDPPGWFLAGRARPYEPLNRSGLRPLIRVEQTIADALLARPDSDALAAGPFGAELTARTAVALIRTVGIRRRQLERAGTGEPPDVDKLVGAAFDELSRAVSPAL